MEPLPGTLRGVRRPGRRARPLAFITVALVALFTALFATSLAAPRHAVKHGDADESNTPAGAVVAVPAPGQGDERRFMHGIGYASAGGNRNWVFFSSSGLPPRGPNRNGSWPHDVYVGEWSPSSHHVLHAHVFISKPEAQEPVSVAQSASGNIFVSFEDGWNAPNTLSQRYGVYGADLKPIKAYPNDVESGGHSGHVAAVGDRFVVFYSEDWVDGGGVDNLGTGGGVYVKVYSDRGQLLSHLDVAAHVREWWPMIAGSPHRAVLVWQKYIAGEIVAELKCAVLDPVTGKIVRPEHSLDDSRVEYYTYAAAWVPAVGRFVIEATLATGRTSVWLVDEDGHTTARLECLPASVREASIGVNGNVTYVPTRDGRLMALALTENSIKLRGLQRAPFAWGNTGAIGMPQGADAMHFVSLSPTGLREADFNVRDEAAPSASDHCGPNATH
jgi:hypothetical protein